MLFYISYKQISHFVQKNTLKTANYVPDIEHMHDIQRYKKRYSKFTPSKNTPKLRRVIVYKMWM